jgi:SsrA-binding protein
MSSKSGGAKKRSGSPVIADNRRARFDYEILDTLEVGIQLTGTEVKSLRANKANIAESYVQVKNGELWLINANIPEYTLGNRFNHEPRRTRKLLAHGREIARLFQGTSRDGLTVVPLKIYFNERGRVKLEIALAKGKKKHDKRETAKERDWQRDKARLLRERG